MTTTTTLPLHPHAEMVLSWGLANHGRTTPPGVNESVGAVFGQHSDALAQVSACLHLIDMVRCVREHTRFNPLSRANSVALSPYKVKHVAENWAASQGGPGYILTQAWWVTGIHTGEITPTDQYVWRIPKWLELLLRESRDGGISTYQGALHLTWTPTEAA